VAQFKTQIQTYKDQLLSKSNNSLSITDLEEKVTKSKESETALRGEIQELKDELTASYKSYEEKLLKYKME